MQTQGAVHAVLCVFIIRKVILKIVFPWIYLKRFDTNAASHMLHLEKPAFPPYNLTIIPQHTNPYTQEPFHGILRIYQLLPS